MKVHATYECEICGFTYPTAEEAQRCEAIPIRRIEGIQDGEIIAGIGNAIGHWAFESGPGEWLLPEPGDQSSRDHLERGKGGWVKWVVLGRVLYRTVGGMGGAHAHCEVLLLYTPTHPCHTGNGPAFVWAPWDGRRELRRLGHATTEQMNAFSAATEGRKASLI